MANIEDVARAFVNHYYTTFDTNRSNLATLYKSESMLSFEGEKFQGQHAILKKITELPFQSVKHAIVTFDCQPAPGNGILVFVCGSLTIDGNASPLKFSQVFNLLPQGAQQFFVLNDMFRLNIG
eukprot:TRINITY_DN1488_c0_g1_i1.p1 TRINITY_DN1488_c0_g1~~TRINITY_DN1488_c0_g1_i1.p1  ORF type:complete len:124 (-),score=20.10 TRINITY_DN1488_c0_g1_i1:87-458(-)